MDKQTKYKIATRVSLAVAMVVFYVGMVNSFYRLIVTHKMIYCADAFVSIVVIFLFGICFHKTYENKSINKEDGVK